MPVRGLAAAGRPPRPRGRARGRHRGRGARAVVLLPGCPREPHACSRRSPRSPRSARPSSRPSPRWRCRAASRPARSSSARATRRTRATSSAGATPGRSARTRTAARSCWPRSAPATSSASWRCSTTSCARPPSRRRTSSTSLAIRGEDMRRLMHEHAEIAVKLAVSLVRRLRGANERLARQSFQTVQSRVAAVLGQLVDQARSEGAEGDRDVTITATQADLAKLAGSSRESASRFLAVLERAGVITQGRGRLDRPRPGRAAAAMSTETSYGGVVVRGRRGARDRAARAAPGARAAQGRDGPRRDAPSRPPRARCARRRASPSRSASGSARSTTPTAAAAARSRRPCTSTCAHFEEGDTADHDHEVDDALLDAARGGAPPALLPGRAAHDRAGTVRPRGKWIGCSPRCRS